MGNGDKENMENFDVNTAGVQEIVQKAILEPEFRKKLIESPDEILDQFNISGISRILKSME